MCGIFGYLNYETPQTRGRILQMLVNGLRRLEYRGYDSAGVAVQSEDGTHPEIFRMKGNINELEKCLSNIKLDKSAVLKTHVGIAHTRWATHGEPCERNSHPQSSDDNNSFVVVHNGIITNYAAIKTMLAKKGYVFTSDTDTEVIVKLARFFYEQDPSFSFRKLMAKVCSVLQGAYAILVLSSHFPNELVAAKVGSPLIIGVKHNRVNTGGHLSVAPITRSLSTFFSPCNGESGSVESIEYFVASDASALIEHTKTVMYLEDGDIVHFKAGEFGVYNMKEQETNRTLQTLQMELDAINRGNFAHYMLKEIYEQEETVVATMRGRVDFENCAVTLGGIAKHLADIRRSQRLLFIACGTSYHSAVATRSILEELTQMNINVELASDFLDRSPPVFRSDTCVFISQSGETADTLRALEYCKQKAALCVGITNTVGSAIARMTDCGIYLNCGPEIGVASTKAYTSQIVAITLLAIKVGEDRTSSQKRIKSIIRGLQELPKKIAEVLKIDAEIRTLALGMQNNKSLLIIGRGYQFASCLEAALKIKEISYMHCEGILAGELKHGTLALVDDTMPIIVIATHDFLHEKIKSTLAQVTARKADPIIVCNTEDDSIEEQYRKIRVPITVDCLQGIVNIIPMQLLAYHTAVLRGYNVDQPRNLAKSVTVE